MAFPKRAPISRKSVIMFPSFFGNLHCPSHVGNSILANPRWESPKCHCRNGFGFGGSRVTSNPWWQGLSAGSSSPGFGGPGLGFKGFRPLRCIPLGGVCFKRSQVLEISERFPYNYLLLAQVFTIHGYMDPSRNKDWKRTWPHKNDSATC